MSGQAGAIAEFAPAKVNLALHVTGRRADGFHLLDSIVAFVAVGDRLEASPGEGLTLELTGPRTSGVPVDGNLVLKAAGALRLAAGKSQLGARLRLDKHLPAAAGLGGGSSDAAAALRALNRLWGLGLENVDLMNIGGDIGADVPVCVAAASARLQGIGERVTPLPVLPDLHLVLANPARALATASVFGGLAEPDNPGLPAVPGQWKGVAHVVEYLGDCRNDLTAPAMSAEPEIRQVLAALAGEPACLLARMSGSGATCFGLFATAEDAAAAAAALARQHPHWWVTPARVL